MRAELETNEKIRNFFQGSFILQKEPGKNMCTKEQTPLQSPLNPAASPGSLASPSWCCARWWVHQTSSNRGAWDVPAPPGALSADLGCSFFGGKVPGTSLTLACKVRALLPAILTQRCVSVGTGTEGNTASSSSEDVSASFGRGTFQLMHPPSCNCERSQPPAGGSGFLLTSWRAFPAGICLLGYCMYYFPKCLY